MRDIKFRVVDEVRNFIYEIHSINFQEGFVEVITGHDRCYPPNPYIERIGIEHIRLIQYTGLKDKNGVDIYEGDIVRFHGQVFDVANCPVEFWEGRFIFRLTENSYKDIMGWRDTEIIGNIYENPELLK